MSTDEEIWEANTYIMPWQKAYEFNSIPDFIQQLEKGEDYRDIKYFIQLPAGAPVVVRARIAPGKVWNLSEEYSEQPFIIISLIISRITGKGNGTYFMSQLIKYAHEHGYMVLLQGSYNPMSRAMAERLGMFRNGYYEQYII